MKLFTLSMYSNTNRNMKVLPNNTNKYNYMRIIEAGLGRGSHNG